VPHTADKWPSVISFTFDFDSDPDFDFDYPNIVNGGTMRRSINRKSMPQGERWTDIAVRLFERNACRHTPSLAHRSTNTDDDYGLRQCGTVRGHTSAIGDYDYEQDYDYDLLAAMPLWDISRRHVAP